MIANLGHCEEPAINSNEPSKDNSRASDNGAPSLIAGLVSFLIGAFVTQIIGPTDTEHAESKSEQKKKSAARDPIVWFTGGLCLATACSVIVLALQWQTLEKTDQTWQAEQRPWIKISAITPANDFVFDTSGAKGSFNFSAKNVGKSVALNVYPSFQMYVFINQKYPARFNDEVSSVAGETCQPKTMPIKTLDIAGEAIFPDEEFPGNRIYGAYEDRSEIDKAVTEHAKDKGSFLIFVAACVDYRTENRRYKTGIHYTLMERDDARSDWHYMSVPILASEAKRVLKDNWDLQRVPNGYAR